MTIGRDHQQRSVDAARRALRCDRIRTFAAVGRTRGTDCRHEREPQREHVHADVNGVAGQRQTVRAHAAPKLERRDERRDAERKDQPRAASSRPRLGFESFERERRQHRPERQERLAFRFP